MPDTWDTGAGACAHTFVSMKLAMFGATGTVGSVLAGKALAAGHELRVLRPHAGQGHQHGLPSEGDRGNAKDPDAVRRTVAGTDAVVSMLGGFADPDSIRIGTAVITAAMGGRAAAHGPRAGLSPGLPR